MQGRLSVLGALAATGIVAAGSPSQAPTPFREFRVTSTLVQFEALFLDDQGRPVADIRKDEVTVRQAGKPVTLVDFRFDPRGAIVRGSGSTASPGATTPVEVEASSQSEDAVEPWVFLVDDLAMSPDGFARARAGLQALLQRDLPGGVEVGVLRTGELGTHTTKLSADRERLLREVAGMRYRNSRWRGGLMSRSGATGAGTAGKDRVFLEGTLGSLNSLLLSLRPLPGRKVVVVMSEMIALTAAEADHPPGGLAIMPTVQYASVADRLRRLGRLAAEAGVTVHTVDLAGVINVGSMDRAELVEGLHAIADELGGVYLGKSNDVGQLLDRLTTAEQGRYVIAYVPPAGTFDDGGKARFVPITVSVVRPGVAVRTRSGFFTR